MHSGATRLIRLMPIRTENGKMIHRSIYSQANDCLVETKEDPMSHIAMLVVKKITLSEYDINNCINNLAVLLVVSIDCHSIFMLILTRARRDKKINN